MQEKERYELLIKIREQNTKLKEIKSQLKDKDTQIMVLKHEKTVALSKQQMQGADASFVNSTPSPQKKETKPSPEIKDQEPIPEAV